jgi:ubiquinol-cytochrome c reductase cytochrome c subunit
MRKMGIFAVLAASTVAMAQQPAGDARRGATLFMHDGCYACHGTVGHGAPYGPKLAPHAIPWEAFQQQVRHPRGSMPHYEPRFTSDQDLADIYAYVASIPEGRPANRIPLLKD